jgi:hypothetical protein
LQGDAGDLTTGRSRAFFGRTRSKVALSLV